MMKVSRDQVIVLMNALGFKNSEDWKKAKMLGKIKSLKDTPELDQKKLTIKGTLLDRLLKAVEQKEDILIASEKKNPSPKKKTTDAKSKPKGTKAKEGKTGEGTKAKKGKTATKKVARIRDVWGSPEGAATHAINGLFLKDKKRKFAIKDILDKLNGVPPHLVKQRIYNLTRFGHIKKGSDSKYSFVK